MDILRQIGNQTNTPTNEYMVETKAELNKLTETAPFGSWAILIPQIDNKGILVYVMNSKHKWILVDGEEDESDSTVNSTEINDGE